MVEELKLIERLEGLRRVLKSGNKDLVDVILLGMIEEQEQKVAEFEAQYDEEMA